MVDVGKYCIERKKPTENVKWICFQEVDGLCPLCGKSLISRTKGTRLICEIAHIFPCNPTDEEKKELSDVPVLGANSEEIENKIALCKDCHRDYDYRKTKGEYMHLYNIKQSLLHKYDAKQALSLLPVEDELKDIVNLLSNECIEDLDSLIELNYNALCIREKIQDQYALLIKDIEENVSKYFLHIQDLFKNQPQPQNDFDTIALSFKHAYKTIAKKGNAPQIFESISTWLRTKTRASKQACDIMTSFFIQNCDIYDKLPK